MASTELLPGSYVVRHHSDDQGNERGRVEGRLAGHSQQLRWHCHECNQSSRWYDTNADKTVFSDLEYHLDADCPGELAL